MRERQEESNFKGKVKMEPNGIWPEGSFLRSAVLRNVEGIDVFFKEVTIAIALNNMVNVIVAGESGGGKTVIARQLKRELRAIFGEDVNYEHFVYDEERNEIVKMGGVPWGEPSEPGDLAAASFSLANMALRKLRVLKKSGKGVVSLIEAPIVTGEKVDMGYSTVKWMIEASKGRADEQYFAMAVIPDDEVRRQADIIRERAWIETPENFAHLLLQSGIALEEEIKDEESLDKFRKSMGTKEFNEIVRMIIARRVYKFQFDREKGLWPIREFELRELDANEKLRCGVFALHYTRLFQDVFHIPPGHLLIAFNTCMPQGEKVFYPRREEINP